MHDPKPVDLTDLREMTDGDKELEMELFQEFIDCGERTIKTLHEACLREEVDIWHESSHALKGVAYNLGAAHLGHLCKEGQESDDASMKEKAVLLDEIIKEYEKVKTFLLNEVA